MARRFTAIVGILAVAIATACPPARAAVDHTSVGMGVHMMFDGPAEVDEQFDLMSRMRVQIVRVDFDWSAIEELRGQYDWAYTDMMVDEASSRGMRILALLTYTPGWARPSGTTSHAAPTRATDFADFAKIAAARYSSRGVRTWEVWNEPNSSDYWQPRPDIDRYGVLFRTAAAAIRDMDSDATLITGGLTRGTDTGDGRRISQATFLKGMYRNGAAKSANAIGVHPYSFPHFPSPGTSNDRIVGAFADLPTLHALMREEGDADKLLWATEFGAATGTAADAVSERDQADSLLDARRLARLWDWMGPLIFYELRDSGTDVADLEQNFGVLRHDLSTKQSARALMN